SGTAATSAYLGCHSAATMTFDLCQEFDITSPDPAAGAVVLAVDSTLVGYLRSKHKGGARVKLATATVAPPGAGGAPLVLSHPPPAGGGAGRPPAPPPRPPAAGPADAAGALPADGPVRDRGGLRRALRRPRGGRLLPRRRPGRPVRPAARPVPGGVEEGVRLQH